MGTKDQLLRSALHGTAMRYAAERRNLDGSIEELRQVADGRNHILAEAAGITAGSWYAWPATHVGYERGMRSRKGERDLDSPRQSLPWIATHQKNRPQSPTPRVIERGDDLGLLRSPPFGAHRFLSLYRPSSVGTLLAFRSEVGQRV